MPKFKDSILSDIKKKHIQPRPRWQYTLLTAGLWASGIMTLIIGSMACALVILEFSLPERAYIGWMEMHDAYWTLALPYIWGIGMVCALTLGYIMFSKTERGYKIPAGIIALILILGSILGGQTLYISGFAHRSDRMIQDMEPRFGKFREGMNRMVPRPEEGTLGIRVQKIEQDNIWGKTPEGREWLVILKCSDDQCRKDQGQLELFRPTLFKGKIKESQIFEAEEIIMPLKKPHMNRFAR